MHLGIQFAKRHFFLISAGCPPADAIADKMFSTLIDSGQYSAAKIFTAYRTKDSHEELKVKRFGHHAFIGNIHDVRNHWFDMATVMIAIGGCGKQRKKY